MATSYKQIGSATPMGANVVPGGATFRVWAPSARAVYVAFEDPGKGAPVAWQPNASDLLTRLDEDWVGFFPGVHDGARYRYFVEGTGTSGFKRDPYARELEMDHYPQCNCIVRDPSHFVWRDAGFQAPASNELVVYQFHLGVFFAEDAAGNDIRANRVGKFLDAVDRIEYLADLGVNAVMPLPFQEFQTENGLGYNSTDLFAPEMDYGVRDGDLEHYLLRVNRLYTQKGFPARELSELEGQVNQLKIFIDLCHVYGLSVIADLGFNHAGGPFDDQSLYFFDRQLGPDNINSQYFLRVGNAGGLVFNFGKPKVRQFLIDSAKALLNEYHVNGLRHDQLTVIEEHGGWHFAQELSGTLHRTFPGVPQIAEYWGVEAWKGVAAAPAGMGFDVGYSDTLRDCVRNAVEAASRGRDSRVNLDAVKSAILTTYKLPGRHSVFQCIESHDLLDVNHTDRKPRIAALADPSNARSWYARSRAKVATGLLLTAPGIPMLFMGQEFLEDKFWSDYPKRLDLFIYWQGLEADESTMRDQHRFTRELIGVRRQQPALCADGVSVHHVHNQNRVLAFRRWVPGVGRDVVVVASLNEASFDAGSYRVGFPSGGRWREVFNSDEFESFPNPNLQGNVGGVLAEPVPWDGLSHSAALTLPANSLLVFAREA